MKIFILFAQRKQNYEGEYMPEALECVTEYVYEENPVWIECKEQEALASGEFESVKIIPIQINDQTLLAKMSNKESIKGNFV